MKKNFLKFLIIFLIVFYPLKANAAEILQINSSNTILVGDQNRNLQIRLFCVDINDEDEQEALNLLKKEFPRGSKVKIKPMGFKENLLLAKVSSIDENKSMSGLLITSNLTKEDCKN